MLCYMLDVMVDFDANQPDITDEDPDTDSMGGGSNAVTQGEVPIGTGSGGSTATVTYSPPTVTRPSATVNVEHVTIIYAGRTLNYGYYTRNPFTINIGTYFFEEILK